MGKTTPGAARAESVGNALGAVLLPLGLIFGLVLLLSLNVGTPGAEAVAENPLELGQLRLYPSVLHLSAVQ